VGVKQTTGTDPNRCCNSRRDRFDYAAARYARLRFVEPIASYRKGLLQKRRYTTSFRVGAVVAKNYVRLQVVWDILLGHWDTVLGRLGQSGWPRNKLTSFSPGDFDWAV